MAWTDLKAAVAAVIRTNGNQEITGSLLQSTLNSIIDQVGANASYKGVAIPSTNPGAPDALVFYIASTQGTYSNFGGFVLDGGFAVLSNISGSWTGTKFLKTEMDAKANHGYESNPKTLKEVDDNLVQLAGEASFVNAPTFVQRVINQSLSVIGKIFTPATSVVGSTLIIGATYGTRTTYCVDIDERDKHNIIKFTTNNILTGYRNWIITDENSKVLAHSTEADGIERTYELDLSAIVDLRNARRLYFIHSNNSNSCFFKIKNSIVQQLYDRSEDIDEINDLLPMLSLVDSPQYINRQINQALTLPAYIFHKESMIIGGQLSIITAHPYRSTYCIDLLRYDANTLLKFNTHAAAGSKDWAITDENNKILALSSGNSTGTLTEYIIDLYKYRIDLKKAKRLWFVYYINGENVCSYSIKQSILESTAKTRKDDTYAVSSVFNRDYFISNAVILNYTDFSSLDPNMIQTRIPSVTHLENGNILIALEFRDNGDFGTQFIVAKIFDSALNTLSTLTLIPNQATNGRIMNPQLFTTKSGRVFVFADAFNNPTSTSNGPGYVVMRYSDDNGATWSSIINLTTINDTYMINGSPKYISIAPGGNGYMLNDAECVIPIMFVTGVTGGTGSVSGYMVFNVNDFTFRVKYVHITTTENISECNLFPLPNGKLVLSCRDDGATFYHKRAYYISDPSVSENDFERYEVYDDFAITCQNSCKKVGDVLFIVKPTDSGYYYPAQEGYNRWDNPRYNTTLCYSLDNGKSQKELLLLTEDMVANSGYSSIANIGDSIYIVAEYRNGLILAKIDFVTKDMILRSPDNTRFAIKVDNEGNLSALML